MITLKFCISAIALTALFSCSQTAKDGDNKASDTSQTTTTTEAVPPVTEPTTASSQPSLKEITLSTGKKVIIEETHPNGASLSNIKVWFADNQASEMVYSDVDPINRVLTGDLDANKFDEIYIWTTSAASGSYGKIIGLASLGDKSFALVNLPEVGEKDLAPGGNFEGYEGHDEFDIIENSLSRTFPVKSDKGSKRAINYKMKPGEAGYQLWVKTSTVY
jgi:hypothetical protein